MFEIALISLGGQNEFFQKKKHKRTKNIDKKNLQWWRSAPTTMRPLAECKLEKLFPIQIYLPIYLSLFFLTQTQFPNHLNVFQYPCHVFHWNWNQYSSLPTSQFGFFSAGKFINLKSCTQQNFSGISWSFEI